MRHDTTTIPVELEKTEDGLGIIHLNRPAAFNALDLDLAEGLLDALVDCDCTPGVRVVIVTGRGKSFCAGGDIKQMHEMAQKADGVERFLKKLTVYLHGAVSTIAQMPKPVIMAVNGSAAGAGLSLTLAGDLTIASEDTSFCVAYTGIGLAPDGGSTFFLPRILGRQKAFELISGNPVLTAPEARDLGLVNRIVAAEDLLEAAKTYARDLMAGPGFALGQAKLLLRESASASLGEQLERERQAIAQCGRTEDFRKGIDAFANKTRPKFGGTRYE